MKVPLGLAVVMCVAWAPLHFTIKKLLGVSYKHLFLCFLLSFVHGFLKFLNTFLPKDLHLEHPLILYNSY